MERRNISPIPVLPLVSQSIDNKLQILNKKATITAAFLFNICS
jgi:hypothetical protein